VKYFKLLHFILIFWGYILSNYGYIDTRQSESLCIAVTQSALCMISLVYIP